MTPDQHQSISELYGFLARLWLREVDDILLAGLTGTIGKTLGVSHDTKRVDLEELAIDFCALFIGPQNHLPPYQSVWSEGQLQTEIGTSVQEIASVVGLSLPGKTMSDHLGVQLQVMSQINRHLTDMTNQIELRAIARFFFQRHLTWTNALLESASVKASTVFYRSVVQLTSELLESERNYWLSANSSQNAAP